MDMISSVFLTNSVNYVLTVILQIGTLRLLVPSTLSGKIFWLKVLFSQYRGICENSLESGFYVLCKHVILETSQVASSWFSRGILPCDLQTRKMRGTTSGD